MNTNLIPFGAAELAVIGGYIALLLVLGWYGKKARRENTLRDFYLAGGSMGFVVLLLTLYATQYSGNTFLAFTGKSYRVGFSWTMSVHFMTAIVVFYLVFAPRLYVLAKQKGFITPTDYLQDRFGNPGLNVVATVIMIAAISNYLMAQLMVMGHVLVGLTNIAPEKAFPLGVIMLALIILIYETMGGLRAVAWTDVMQGGILTVAFVILLWLIFDKYGSLETATGILLAGDKSELAKVLPPDAEKFRQWFSYILVIGVGGALYPQAIQRIYAAKSSTTLRRSLAVMAFLPLTTALVALLVGVVGVAHLPGLENADADRILPLLCRQIQEHSLLGHWLVVVLFAGILAAVMSTADSVLLTTDLYGPYCRPDANESDLTRIGKVFSWGLIAVLAALAIYLNTLPGKPTLIKLLDMKFDMLIQLAPAFMVGIHWTKMRPRPTLIGMIVGLAIALGLAATGYGKIAGFHAGLYGLAVNLLIAVLGSVLFTSHERT